MSETKYPIVRVKWVDADIDNSWRDAEELANEQEGPLVTTIGYLVRKPSKSFKMYIVAGTVAFQEYMLHNAITKIPKAWVQSIEYLNIPEREEKDGGNGEQGV